MPFINGQFVDKTQVGGTAQPSTTTPSGGINLEQLLLLAGMKDPKNVTKYSALQGLVKNAKEAQKPDPDEQIKSLADRAITQLEDLYMGNKLHYGPNLKGAKAEVDAFLGHTVIGNPNLPYVQYKDYLQSIGARLAKMSGDTGNISIVEQALQKAPFPNARTNREKAVQRFADIRTKFGLPKRSYDQLDSYSPYGLTGLSTQFGGQ